MCLFVLGVRAVQEVGWGGCLEASEKGNYLWLKTPNHNTFWPTNQSALSSAHAIYGMCTQHARFEGHTWCRRAERPPGAGFSHHYCIWLHIQWSLTASNSHQNQASPIACEFWCFSINAGLYFRNVFKFDFCLNRHNNRNMQNLFCCTIIDKPFNTAYISANTLLCCKFLHLFIFNWFAFQQQYENKIYFQKDLETNWFSNETVFLCVAVRMKSYLIVPVGEGRGLIILLKSFSGMLIFSGEIWG